MDVDPAVDVDLLLDRATGHEQVVLAVDPASGMRAIVAIASTALGPALGGTRFHPYPRAAQALADALRLSRAMALKNSLAGLPHGGGKAVIIGDPARDKSTAVLQAYGDVVASLGGRYVTAADVGTAVADMDVVATRCRWVTGRSESAGGAGDSGVLTARGVFRGMQAAAEHVWGTPSLGGRRVGVLGVGKVGRRLVAHLLEDGADVVASDVDAEALAALAEAHPQVKAVAGAGELLAEPLDVLSPNALGGLLDDDLAARLEVAVICGGANNQLAHPAVADVLASRGVLYCPDFLVNAGGVIQVADELLGFSFDRAAARTDEIGGTTRTVLDHAVAAGITPERAAVALAQDRMTTGTGGWGSAP